MPFHFRRVGPSRVFLHGSEIGSLAASLADFLKVSRATVIAAAAGLPGGKCRQVQWLGARDELRERGEPGPVSWLVPHPAGMFACWRHLIRARPEH